MASTKWRFSADYFTFCNCDWGCPCNFNARPTQGTCNGIGAWEIREGTFGSTKLDGVRFAVCYFFPGLIEQGNGTARNYVDRRATPAQRKAIETIASGRVGGGIFEVFPKLAPTFYPLLVTDIDLSIDGGKAHLRIGDIAEAESDLLSYPDGMVIEPSFTLPHGIEFKTALATNAKRWWVRDEAMLGSYTNRYAAVARVTFSEKGCIG
jgi:hypothetical protein